MSVQRLCFVHIPKCGGTSLNEAFKKSVGLGPLSWKAVRIDAAKTMKEAQRRHMNTLALRQEKLVARLKNKRLRYIKGHVRCTMEVRRQFTSDWMFVTVLRDPVKRWISQYYFNLHKKNPHTKHSMDLDEYLDSEIAKTSGAIYIDFLTDGNDLNSNQAIKETIENLSEFDIVGILENMDPFKKQFKKLLGKDLMPVGNRNTNPLPKDQMKKGISDNQMQKIIQLCTPDIQVYEHFRTVAQETSKVS